MDDEPEEIETDGKTSRSKDLSKTKDMRVKLKELFDAVNKGFDDQRKRADSVADNWDAYNSVLSDNQYYSGNSKIFIPIVNDAVNARKTRFVNQLFPQNGRYVEVTSGEADQPQALMSLMEHYVRKCKLRTQVAGPICVNGDCEGQYTLYTGWREIKKRTATRQQKPVMIDGMEIEPDVPGGEPIPTVSEEDTVDAYPYVELVPDADFLVLPATADSIEDALENGGSVSIQRRWSKAAIRRMIAEGDIGRTAGEKLLAEMSTQMSQPNTRQNTKKDQAKAAGIKAGGRFVLGYEVWSKFKVDDEMRLCVSYFGGENQILGSHLCPYWSDLVPLISAPAEKVAGVFKGKAPVSNVLDMQIFANDTINEGADTSHFSAMPPIMTDPLKNPRIETMVYGLGAVWSTSPNDTKILQFPDLWRTSIERAGAIKEQIFQSLGVNPAMIPQSTGGASKKRNQAEIANEQQVDILTTAEAVTVMEEGVFTPLLQRWMWYDHQFRDEAITIRKYGPLGVEANMERIDPIQMDDRYDVHWYGVEAARNAARLQQQNAVAATLMKIPPNLYPEYEFNIAPLMVAITGDTFGPRLAPQIFKKKSLMTVDPQTENEMMLGGFEPLVHFGDDDMAHLQAHMPLAKDVDPNVQAKVRDHIMRHQKQMQAKADMQMQQSQGQPPPGGGGGPQPGAVPSQPKVDGPPGAIHPDQMPAAGAVGMPRKM